MTPSDEPQKKKHSSSAVFADPFGDDDAIARVDIPLDDEIEIPQVTQSTSVMSQ